MHTRLRVTLYLHCGHVILNVQNIQGKTDKQHIYLNDT